MTGSFPPNQPFDAGQPQMPNQPQGPGQPHNQYQVPSQKKSGGSRLLKIGPILLVVGLLLGLVLGFLGINSIPDLDAVPQATGEQQPVELTTGEWTIYAENGFGTPTIVGPDGAAVPIQSSFTSSNYSINGRTGNSVGKVDISTAGTYSVTSPAGQTTVFGQGLLSSIFRSVLLIIAGVLGGGLLFLTGLIMTIIGFVRR